MEYTYKRWLEGRFDYNHIYDEKGKSRLTKIEQSKINKKQKTIFDELLKEKTKDKIEEIKESLEIVPDKTLYIRNYITAIDNLFNKEVDKQPIVTRISDFTSTNEIDFIVYEGVYTIAKDHFKYFKYFYDKFVFRGCYDYEVISNSNNLESNWELSLQLDAYTLLNTQQYLHKLNFGTKPVKLIPIQISNLYQREKIIEGLYQGLYPDYIKVSKNEFVTHFGIEFTPIKWEKTEPELKGLIDMLVGKFSDDVILKDAIIMTKYENKLIGQHFTTNLGKKFKSKQLSDMKKESSYSRILNPEYGETSNLYLLVRELENFKKTIK